VVSIFSSKYLAEQHSPPIIRRWQYATQAQRITGGEHLQFSSLSDEYFPAGLNLTGEVKTAEFGIIKCQLLGERQRIKMWCRSRCPCPPPTHLPLAAHRNLDSLGGSPTSLQRPTSCQLTGLTTWLKALYRSSVYINIPYDDIISKRRVLCLIIPEITCKSVGVSVRESERDGGGWDRWRQQHRPNERLKGWLRFYFGLGLAKQICWHPDVHM